MGVGRGSGDGQSSGMLKGGGELCELHVKCEHIENGVGRKEKVV